MPHTDLDELVNTVLPYAQEMLEQQGEFVPFGALLQLDGTVESVAVEAADEAPPQEVVEFLTGTLSEHAGKGEVRAVGICVDVRVTPPGEREATDAIVLQLQHASGEAIDVLLPYRQAGQGRYEYGELFAAEGSLAIFPGTA